MPDLPPITSRWLADHHGVVTSAVLRSHGVSRATIRRLVHADVLRRPTRGVFVAASSGRTVEQRCAELSASHPAGFVTGPTAGFLAGLRRMPRAAPLHYAVHHGVHLPADIGVRWRQTTVIWAVDRRHRDDGIVVASWPRLAFDLAADLRQLDHLSVVNQLLDERRVSTEELVDIDRRLGHPARSGSGVFRRTLESLGGSSPAGQSHPEVVLADALQRLGVPVEPQAPVRRPTSGGVIHLDLAVPTARWGVELDIHPEHRSIECHWTDAQRRRDLHLMAWQIEVVTERDMLDPEVLAHDLARLYHARCAYIVHPSVS